MKKQYRNNNSERGTAIVEFALTAAFFLMMIMAIVSGGHLFFTHNAMVESTRRGARYAAFLAKPPTECNDPATLPVKNMVLYGTPTAGTTPLVNNLQTSNVSVCYSENYGVAQGTVTVKIVNYSYTFAVAGRIINMPEYQTTVAGESAGAIPGITCP